MRWASVSGTNTTTKLPRAVTICCWLAAGSRYSGDVATPRTFTSTTSPMPRSRSGSPVTMPRSSAEWRSTTASFAVGSSGRPATTSSRSMPGDWSGTPISVPCTFTLSPPSQTASVAVTRLRTVATPGTLLAALANCAELPPWTT